MYRLKNFPICSMFLFWSVILLVLKGVMIPPATAQYFDPDPIEIGPPNPPEHFYGWAVWGYPDMDGDGSGDVMVTCHEGVDDGDGRPEPGEVTRIYFYDGASGAVLRSIVDQNNGYYHRLIGDVNGDGISDLLTKVRSVQRVDILDGSTGEILHSLFSPNEEVGGNFSSDISGIPDVNGDGVVDALVGASGEAHETGQLGLGRAYIFDGATGLLLRTLTSPEQQLCGRFGGMVTGLSDMNGDGYGDAAVSTGQAGGEPTCELSVNRVYVFSGASGAFLYKLEGGLVVSEIPDLNDDGIIDVLVRASIFDGATGVLLRTISPPTTDGFYPFFGQRAQGLPDIDGDGQGDLALKSGDTFNSVCHARLYIVSGATGEILQTLSAPYTDCQFYAGYSNFHGLSLIPDTSGDGRVELVAGDHHAGSDGTGRIFIYLSLPQPTSVDDWNLY